MTAHGNPFPGSPAFAYGDAQTMDARAQGGNDIVTASGGLDGFAYGDAQTMSGNAHGGNDSVNARGERDAVAYGDAQTMTDHVAMTW